MNRRHLFAAAALVGAAAAATPAEAQRRPSAPGGFIETRNGVRLFHRDTGEGAPLVFLGGWTLPSDAWNYQTVALAEQGFRCIAYDRRGHGRSDDPGRGFDYDTLADDLAAVLDTLNLTNVTLVGHSMASGEMIRVLARPAARRIAKLIFVAPAATPALSTLAPPAVFEAQRQQILADFPGLVRANIDPFFTLQTSQAMKDWMVSLMLQCSMAATIGCQRALTTADFRAELPRIAKPTLVIHGALDASAPLAATGRPTAEMIPNAELIVYEDGPHGLPFTHAQRLNADIAAFVRR